MGRSRSEMSRSSVPHSVALLLLFAFLHADAELGIAENLQMRIQADMRDIDDTKQQEQQELSAMEQQNGVDLQRLGKQQRLELQTMNHQRDLEFAALKRHHTDEMDLAFSADQAAKQMEARVFAGEMDSNQGEVSKVQKLSDDQAQEADAIKQQRSKELAVTLHKQKEEIKLRKHQGQKDLNDSKKKYSRQLGNLRQQLGFHRYQYQLQAESSGDSDNDLGEGLGAQGLSFDEMKDRITQLKASKQHLELEVSELKNNNILVTSNQALKQEVETLKHRLHKQRETSGEEITKLKEKVKVTERIVGGEETVELGESIDTQPDNLALAETVLAVP